MGLDNNDRRSLPSRRVNIDLSYRIRYRLIRWLARDTPVVLNTIMRTPPGWAIGVRDLDGGCLIARNDFREWDYEFVPGTVVVSRSR